jgi:hypothetical protein
MKAAAFKHLSVSNIMAEHKKQVSKGLEGFSLRPATDFTRKPATRPATSKPAADKKPAVILLPASGELPVLDEPLPGVGGRLSSVSRPRPAPRAGSQVGPEAKTVKEHPVPRELLEAFARENPHCRQVLTEAVAPHFADEKEIAPRPLASLPVFIGPDSPRIAFFDRPDDERSPLHYGQLKLLMSEIAFLLRSTDACSGAKWVVPYAGAAPGNHITYLASLFPSCLFLLYDPAPFCDALRASPPENIRVFEKTFFTEEVAADLAEKYADARVAFISDIRTGKEESYVEEDMVRQEAWVRAMKPAVSMVKFRLPWAKGATPYLDGAILWPVYAPLTSTECRLISTKAHAEGPPRVYDNTEYEECCAFHNSVARVRGYAHGVSVPGLDSCHDCAMLVRVVGEYLLATGQDASEGGIGTFIKATVRSFGTGRTLASEYARSSNRSGKERPKRVYDNDQFRVEAQPGRGRGRGGASRSDGKQKGSATRGLDKDGDEY